MAEIVFTGALVAGKGEGRFFTRAEWAREAFQELVGIDPYPGTLNLRVSEQGSFGRWCEINKAPGLVLRAPDSAWCDGRCYPATVQGIKCAVVVPGVSSYPADQVEIIAEVSIRRTLGVGEGDYLDVVANV